ncbi:hypothetical protein SBF1_1510003 [Candidatus Desulfosporosinus infrequens]|uniref:Uncharacterized protein n=1 Tax=Candidatus Desulfosporosinus infrequens TaxID=2043169 RepID=A0A2U3K7J8_9FIRM|nr:hypothetical protein SBF1_1510003 [Candidatus Desulfosporosinus infrequens]
MFISTNKEGPIIIDEGQVSGTSKFTKDSMPKIRVIRESESFY